MFQLMEGVGTPVEVQEILTESPSRTATFGPMVAEVLALTMYKIIIYRSRLLYARKENFTS